jgi:ABC-type proline/glycine betaine transport system substrate-binding protein
VIPLWRPQYLNQAFAIRRLEDPLGVFPAPDRCTLAVTKAFRDRAAKNHYDLDLLRACNERF